MKKVSQIFIFLCFTFFFSAIQACSEYTFGIATVEEAPAISKLVCEAFYQGDQFRVRSDVGCHRTSVTEVLEEMSTKGRTWYVLRDENNAIIATVLYLHIKEKDCGIEMLAKDCTIKNKKLGLELLNEVMTLAKNEGKEKMYLNVCDVNTHLVEYYKKLGFQLTGNSEEFCTDFQEVIIPELRNGKIFCIEMVKEL